MTLKVLDLFSGIGGFSLGLERAGMETVAFCEIEPFCQKVLRKHWPSVPIFQDIRTLHETEIPSPIDLVCGGYPCQPFSLAGKRRGADDDRHLWPEYLRLIQKIHPRWVIAENVAGHIQMGLDAVLSELESENYACWTFVIPACAVDAPHRRDRVWIVAYADPNKPRLQEQHTPYLAARQGLDTGAFVEERRATRWPAEPGVGRVAYGIPNRIHRLKGLGNAVVPQVVEMIGRAIMKAEDLL